MPFQELPNLIKNIPAIQYGPYAIRNPSLIPQAIAALAQGIGNMAEQFSPEKKLDERRKELEVHQLELENQQRERALKQQIDFSGHLDAKDEFGAPMYTNNDNGTWRQTTPFERLNWRRTNQLIQKGNDQSDKGKPNEINPSVYGAPATTSANTPTEISPGNWDPNVPTGISTGVSSATNLSSGLPDYGNDANVPNLLAGQDITTTPETLAQYGMAT